MVSARHVPRRTASPLLVLRQVPFATTCSAWITQVATVQYPVEGPGPARVIRTPAVRLASAPVDSIQNIEPRKLGLGRPSPHTSV